MERNIFTVSATQVVTSQAHPEGLRSAVEGYPKDFDSRSYNRTEQNPNGDAEVAMICARAEFADQVKAFATSASATRVMWTVTLEMANGRQIDRKNKGDFPDMTPPEQNAE